MNNSNSTTGHLADQHISTFLTIISIVGTIGNLIVAFVYWTKLDKQTSTFFILCLAFIDLTVCSVLVPTTIFMENIYFETDNQVFCRSYFFLLTTSVPMSSLLMTAIAFDRFFCICMVNRNIMTLSRARFIGIVLLVISASLGVIPALMTTTSAPNIGSASNSSNLSSSAVQTDSFTKTSHENSFTSTPSFSSLQSTSSNVVGWQAANSSSSSIAGTAPQCRIDASSILVMSFKFFYDFIFIACVIIITVLYILIYSEIYTRRKAKRDRKRELIYNSFLNTGFNLLNHGGGGGDGGDGGTALEPLSPPSAPLKATSVNDNNLKNHHAESTTKSIFFRMFFCLKSSKLTGKDYLNELPDESKKADLIRLSPNVVNQANNDEPRQPEIHEKRKSVGEDKLKRNLDKENEDGDDKDGDKDENTIDAQTDSSKLKKKASFKNGSIRRSSHPPILRQSSIIRRMSLANTKHVISTRDIRTAFMLFVVSFLYIVFYLPSITSTYLILFISEFPNNLYISYLYFSNSAINPIIYCFLNPNFRTDLLKLFFKRGFVFRKCNKNTNLR